MAPSPSVFLSAVVRTRRLRFGQLVWAMPLPARLNAAGTFSRVAASHRG
jgi:hypothetical protein